MRIRQYLEQNTVLDPLYPYFLDKKFVELKLHIYGKNRNKNCGFGKCSGEAAGTTTADSCAVMIPDYLPHPEQLHPLVEKRSSSVYSTQSVRSYNFSSYEADDERSSGDESVCPELDGQSDCLTQRHERDKLTISSRKELVGWYMYSFAAEVFIICGIGTFIPITLEQLARENGVLQSDNTTPCGSNSFHSLGKPSSNGSDSTETCLVYNLGIPVNTASFAMYTFSISVLIEALIVISISGAANYSKIRKRLLLTFAYSGAISTMLFIFIIPDVYFLAALLVVFSNICSGASFVLLNSFLPLIVRNHPRMLYQIALSREPENEMVHSTTTPLLSRLTVDESLPLKDPIITQLELSTQISSTGTGAGYSASLFFQCASVLIIWTLRSTTFSFQVVLFLAGLWWSIFTIPSAILLRPRQESALTTRNLRSSLHSLDWVYFVGKAWSLLWRIVKLARQSTDISLFLLAWLLLSDGIATVPGTTILYAKTILGMKSEELGLINIIVTATGIMGSFTWNFISQTFGLKPNQIILICICLLEVILLYGLCGFLPFVKNWSFIGLQQPWEIYPLCFVYGFVTSGLSSCCRSIFGELIPPGSEAVFYALYSITDRGSSIFGPAIVAAIIHKYGEFRLAFLFTAVLVGLPGPLIWFLDVNRGKKDGQKLAKILNRSRILT